MYLFIRAITTCFFKKIVIKINKYIQTIFWKHPDNEIQFQDKISLLTFQG